MIIEEKGADAGLGSRLVDHPTKPGAPKIRVEQMTPEYLRHQLQHDVKLAEALRNDPRTWAAVQSVINGQPPGTLRYLLVHTDVAGRVTVTEYVIDGGRLGRDTIRLAGAPDEAGGP